MLRNTHTLRNLCIAYITYVHAYARARARLAWQRATKRRVRRQTAFDLT